jgi:hypothetical protein
MLKQRSRKELPQRRWSIARGNARGGPAGLAGAVPGRDSSEFGALLEAELEALVGVASSPQRDVSPPVVDQWCGAARRRGAADAGEWLAERGVGPLSSSDGGGRCVVDECVCQRGSQRNAGELTEALPGGTGLAVDGESGGAAAGCAGGRVAGGADPRGVSVPVSGRDVLLMSGGPARWRMCRP